MSIDLGYGLITCQLHPDRPEGWPSLYAEALDLAVAAENAGLDSVWVSEHHFVDDGHLPSLLVLLAAMAARTRRVRLGTGLLLAPLHDPLRVAEDAAVVDLISKGRLVLGIGLGWRDEEFEAFDVPLRERVARLERLIEVARAGWRGDLVPTSDGAAAPVITPRPIEPEGPPLWIGAMVERSIRRAGRLGDGLLATEVTPAELREQVAVARDERARAGIDAPFAVAVHLPTAVGESFSDVAEQLRYPSWKYEDMASGRSMDGPLARPQPASAEDLDRLAETSIVGSPREVADRIREYADAAGGPLHMIARSYLPGQSLETRFESLHRLGEVALLLHNS